MPTSREYLNFILEQLSEISYRLLTVNPNQIG